jgi:peptidoglycan/xylan/chitin deacetylase (PgdA/CDA1 family)
VGTLKGEALRVAKWGLRPWRRRTRAHALILLYHRIARARSDPWQLCVSPENFRGHLECLQRRCDVVPLAELPARLARARSSDRTPVAITFDDGYADNLHEALPALRAVGAPATVFLATGWIGRSRGFWWDRLAASVLDSGRLPDRFDLSIGATDFVWTRRAAGPSDAVQRRRLHRELWQHFQSASEAEREAALARIEDVFGVTARDEVSARPMTAAEVREMHASGLISVGAHTRTHRPLSTLGVAEQRGEIEGSRQDCLELTGVLPACFAYPYGEFDEASPMLARSAGFSLACSTIEELAWDRGDRFLLPRVSVGNLSAGRFDWWLRSLWLH